MKTKATRKLLKDKREKKEEGIMKRERKKTRRKRDRIEGWTAS